METENPKKVKKKIGIVVKARKAYEMIINDSNESPSGKITKPILEFIRLILASFHKFQKDEALIRGTSITYAMVVSFIPTMVVLLMVGGKMINMEDYFVLADQFVKQNNIPIDIDPYKNIIIELLENAAAIGGIGFLVMLFSATSVLRNIESSLNIIWRVKTSRPMFQKISGFIMVLIFAPILMVIGISLAQSLISKFASPDLYSIKMVHGSVHITGDKHLFIESSKKKKWGYKSIVKKIDYSTQKNPILFNKKENKIITGKIYNEKFLAKVEVAKKSTIASSAFTDFYDRRKDKWIITNSGSVLYRAHSSKVWDVQKFQKYQHKVDNIILNKIVFINNKNGLIIGSDGFVLTSNDGGINWIPRRIDTKGIKLNDALKLPDGSVLAIGNNFMAYKSSDEGKTWKEFKGLSKLIEKDRHALLDIERVKNKIYIVGQYGTYLASRDGGKTWKRNEIGLKTKEFNKIRFLPSGKGILIGNHGFIRVSSDQGKTWIKVHTDTNVNLQDIVYSKKDKRVYIVGEEYNIISNSNKEYTEFSVVVTAPFFRKLVSAVGNFILPFAVIWILFFLLYKIIPNTAVSNKAASLGSATTSLIWVVFLIITKEYTSIMFSAGKMAIYGTLAAIPIALLLFYVSVIIMLFGAEVSFFVQYPSLIKFKSKQWKNEDEKRQIWFGFEILHRLHENFKKGKGGTKISQLIKICNNDQEEFEIIIEKFEEKLYIKKIEGDQYAPLIGPENILLKDIVNMLDLSDFSVPQGDATTFSSKVQKLFKVVEDNKSKTFQNSTLADLL